jgi:hypothetical protein
MRRVLRLYLFWPRLELAFVALLPLGLLIESSIANSSAYGFVGFADMLSAVSSSVALLRGFLFELLTYVCTRTVAIMLRKGFKRYWLACSFMAVLSAFLVLVSAVNNLGWVLAGHDLSGVLTLLDHLLPPYVFVPYQIGLAILLPLSVGGIALVDLDHFVHDLLEKDEMDHQALLVEERDLHRTAFLKGIRGQKSTVEDAYAEVAGGRAQDMIELVREGDMSFGSASSFRVSERPTEVLSLPAPAPTVQPVHPFVPSSGPSTLFLNQR